MTMGTGWRRFSEKARQKWHITLDRSFPATVNLRNEAMMKEAGDFATHLRRCEKDIRTLKNATEGLLITTKLVLSAPLPRVYEDTGNGRVVPTPSGNGPEPESNRIGGDFKVEELTRVSRETARKLDTEVLAPMARWNTAFHTVEMRMKKLEEIRLEVDSRRRTVQELTIKVEKQRDRLPQTRAKGEDEMNNTIKTLQHKENKLAAARQSFKEHEALVYQQLAQLIRDGVWLKSYIAAVMRVEQEAFTTAYNCMGPSRASVGASMSEGVRASEASGLISDSRQTATQSQALSPASAMMRQVVSKMARKTQQQSQQPLGGGKENSALFDAPSAPTHRINADASAAPASRYDRYGDSGAYSNPHVSAW